MKKQISEQLFVFVISVLVLLLVINHFLQIKEVELSKQEDALFTIEQIEDILNANESELEILTSSLREEYIIKAQMVAYILENMDIETTEAYRELVSLLSIDEIHIFTEDGEIYDGSEPKYFGYNFDSGEQMNFFKPLLDDKTLTLCQDIQPNTAEEKPMMYIATWNSDGTEIVQIGIEPERILEEQKNNELSYIFSVMPTSDETVLYAIDVATGVIVGSSEDIYLNRTGEEIGLYLDDSNVNGEKFYAQMEDIENLCVFERFQDTYIGVALNKNVIYDEVIKDMISIGSYFIIGAIFLYCALLKIIDITILHNFELLVEKVGKIAGGDLDTRLDIKTSPEFSKLSNQLNMMVDNLLNTTAKMSHVLDRVDTKIAVYEYQKDMKRVFSTRKLSELLKIEQDELNLLLQDKALFELKIEEIKQNTTEESDVYLLDHDTFLKIETVSSENGEYGVIVDVSDTAKEKRNLRYERDYDVLTELFNRRAFLREIGKLFGNPEKLKEAMIVALDMDNLKEINDTYGHDGGDEAIKLSAKLMKDIPTYHKLACRLGGDEFVVAIYGEESREELLEYICDLETNFQTAQIEACYGNASVRMSAGYILCSDFDVEYKNMLKYADEALYIAKKNGKNQFVQYKGSRENGFSVKRKY